MLILGIESSCDETSAAVVEDGKRILSNVVTSQVDVHARYGGVVPELASREHIRNIIPVVEEALRQAGSRMPDIGAIAVTLGPGLIGSLLVGVETAKMLCFAHRKPLIPVHHIAAHVHSGTLAPPLNAADGEAPALSYPYLSLVVSGGHTSLIRTDAPGRFEVLGQTLDDAVGEAYDKVAKLLRVGYPGGPIIDRLAKDGDAGAIDFPTPNLKNPDFNFSFSGLKTAVKRYVDSVGVEKLAAERKHVCDVAASFQRAAIEALLQKTERALEATGIRQLAVVGGVAANSALRATLKDRFASLDVRVPPLSLCTDNAGMIAALGFQLQGLALTDFNALNADANLPLIWASG